MAVIDAGRTGFRDALHARCGFTLAESVVSILIVSVMLVAALNMVGSSTRTRQVQESTSRDLALAGDLLAEVLHADYAEPYTTVSWGPDSGENTGSREHFDDVDDYDGWSASPPESKTGGTLDGYEGWQRSVRVRYADPAQPDQNESFDSGLKRVQVSVTTDKGKTITLTGLRADGGSYARMSNEDATLIGSVSLMLQMGGQTTPIVSGINLLNDVEGEATVSDESSNSPPEAVAWADPTQGHDPLMVQFWGGASTDPDPDDTLTYHWDFGDGDTTQGEMVSHIYYGWGEFMATLTVTDSAGATATDSVQITVY